MAEEQPPPPPQQLTDPVAAMQARISALEEAAEAGKLDSESKYRGLLISEVNQRIRMRYAVSILATLVILAMAGYAAHAVHHYFVGPFVLISPSLAIVLFLAPVTSVTAITISLLVGVFRRFKDDDIEKIDTKSIVSEALKIGQVR
jgi:hypothetical protein